MGASGRHSQRQFILRVALFWLPVFVVGAIAECFLWRTGETVPIDMVLEAQEHDSEVLFMRKYLNEWPRIYRYKMIERRQPTVLALGSSRVLEFREEMFGEDASRFMNVGGSVRRVEHLDEFLDQFPDLRLKVVLLGVDVWWFNDHVDLPALEGDDEAFSWKAHLLAVRRLLNEERRAVPGLALHPKEKRIGIQAQLANMGFRRDGSQAYNYPVPDFGPGWKFKEHTFLAVTDRIKGQYYSFRPCPGLDMTRLEIFKKGLERLKARGTLVVGFTPPFSAECIPLLETMPQQRPLWTQFRKEIPALFQQLDLPFVDASELGALGLDDRYMIDGYHAFETYHLHLLRRMLQDPRVRDALPTTLAAVDEALRAPGTNPWYAEFPSTGQSGRRVAVMEANKGR